MDEAAVPMVIEDTVEVLAMSVHSSDSGAVTASLKVDQFPVGLDADSHRRARHDDVEIFRLGLGTGLVQVEIVEGQVMGRRQEFFCMKPSFFKGLGKIDEAGNFVTMGVFCTEVKKSGESSREEIRFSAGYFR